MTITTKVHDIRRITRDAIQHYPATEHAREFYFARIRIETDSATFVLDLFARSAEALRVMQDEFLTPRDVEEVTR